MMNHGDMNHMGMGTPEMGMTQTGNGGESGVAMDKGNHSMEGMMKMYFHTGIVEYILFEQLHTDTAAGFALACLVIFVAGFLYELMKYARDELLHRDRARQAREALNGNDEQQSLLRKPRAHLCSRGHLTQTGLHFVQLWLSYCLMLVFMTYNLYLCLCLILGACLGYFLVGWKRSARDLQQESGEHCQ